MKIYRNDVLNRTILVVAILLVIVGIFAVTLETMRASTLTRSKALDVIRIPGIYYMNETNRIRSTLE